MTLNEFKAWLEGFSASFGGDAPNKAQWTAIKAKLEKVQMLAATPVGLPERLKNWPFNTHPHALG